MSKEIRNLGASVLSRLHNKSIEIGLPYNWLLFNFANERFLYRLSQSKYCEMFILKGGLIFVGWNTPLRRLTKDVDFRVYGPDSINLTKQIIEEICVQPVEPDAVMFKCDTIEAEVISPDDEYPGVRIHFLAIIGEKTRVNMQIDMSFTDVITPSPIPISYPTLLDMPSPQLKGYPKETVVAEKLHCIVDRGTTNSRRKDYFDLWFLSQQQNFSGSILQDAIIQTFENRGTQIPNELPAGLSDIYAKENNGQWKAFLHTFNLDNGEVRDFQEVVLSIREFVEPILKASMNKISFNLFWKPGGLWSEVEDQPKAS